MARRVIGTGTTGTDGSVTIPYTGTGAGLVQMDVETEIDGSIVSVPCNVWDTNFGDGGVTGNTNGGFYYTQDQTVVSRQTDNTGTTVTNLTSSLQTIRVNKPNTSIDEKDWVAPLNIEFDILSYTGTLYLQLWKSNNTSDNVSVNLSNFLTGVSNPHVKVLVADGKMKVYVNDVLKTDLVLTFGGLFGIRLLLSDSASFKYKNFFVYGMSKDYCVVTSSNNIVVTGDDLSITGQLYLNDELALNKTLDVYKDGSKVGTASTGNTGTATYTYAGVGDGEVEFQFKYGSIVSEPFNVIDAVFRDRGTSTDYGTWITEFTQINRGDDYTTLTPSDSFDSQYKAISLSNFVIEGDVNLTYSANINFMRFSKNTWTSITVFSAQYDFALTSGQWYHFKLVKQGNSVDVFVDGVKKITKEVNDTVDTFMMLLDNTKTTDLKYKNFVIYPI